MRHLELLSPAGSMEALRAALRFGADAVYAGGPQLQLRAGSAGFTMDMLADAAREVHARGRKLYVTVNAFPTNREVDALGDYAQNAPQRNRPHDRIGVLPWRLSAVCPAVVIRRVAAAAIVHRRLCRSIVDGRLLGRAIVKWLLSIC